MLNPIRRRATQSLIAAAVALLLPMAALCLPKAADGATINMILSDVDVTYFGDAAGDTGSIYDTIGHPGGNLNQAEADEVETVVYELDMVHLGTQMTSAANTFSGDLRIDGVGNTLPKGSLQTGIGNNGGGFGFDYFTESGDRLRLGIDEVDLLLTNGVFFFTGSATVLDQNLPFGLIFDTTQPVQFSYTATLPLLSNGAQSVDRAMGSGALTISGIQIPEPATMILTVVGGLASIALLRRRR